MILNQSLVQFHLFYQLIFLGWSLSQRVPGGGGYQLEHLWSLHCSDLSLVSLSRYDPDARGCLSVCLW